jgi:hypothetical protein
VQTHIATKRYSRANSISEDVVRQFVLRTTSASGVPVLVEDPVVIETVSRAVQQ